MENKLEELVAEVRSALKEPLYTVGDRVELDNGAKGEIMGVMHAFYYFNFIRPNGDYRFWFQQDEEWNKKNVFIVILDKPERYMSYEDFKEFHPEIKEECLYEKYEKEIPPAYNGS